MVIEMGDSDVGENFMLMADNGARIIILMTFSMLKIVNISNLSPTDTVSNIHHQHLCDIKMNSLRFGV